jgi:WhiB family redox-sensing transcriptional regulator
MTGRMNWREDAACRDTDPDLFFPIGTTGNALRQIDEAKRICRLCPAQIQCLAWALENRVTDGVWGAPRKTSGVRSGALREEREPVRKIRMAELMIQQGTENMEYVRSMLRHKQPGFSAALELALALAELELWPPQMPRETSAATAHDH